jgi:hypothetical protein
MLFFFAVLKIFCAIAYHKFFKKIVDWIDKASVQFDF